MFFRDSLIPIYFGCLRKNRRRFCQKQWISGLYDVGIRLTFRSLRFRIWKMPENRQNRASYLRDWKNIPACVQVAFDSARIILVLKKHCNVKRATKWPSKQLVGDCQLITWIHQNLCVFKNISNFEQIFLRDEKVSDKTLETLTQHRSENSKSGRILGNSENSQS